MVFLLGTIHKRRLPKGGGRGVQKMPQKETFTSRFEETRGGRVAQKSKILGDVVYGWSLIGFIFLAHFIGFFFVSKQIMYLLKRLHSLNMVKFSIDYHWLVVTTKLH